MAIKISLTNNKGGVGKTSTAINVGQILVQKHKKRVLIVDLDMQCNVTSAILGPDYALENWKGGAGELFDRRSSASTSDLVVRRKDGPHIIPGRPKDVFSIERGMEEVSDLLRKEVIPAISEAAKSKDPAAARKKILQAKEVLEDIQKANMDWAGILRKRISEVEADYDYVFFDLPPSVSRVPISAWVASDFLLIPVSDHFALEGVGHLLNHMIEIKREFNQDLRFVFYMNKVRMGKNQWTDFIGNNHREIAQHLNSALRENKYLASVSTLMSGFVRYSDDVDTSHAERKPMYNLFAAKAVTDDYVGLTAELIKVTKK